LAARTPLRIGLIGAGRIGTFHASSIAQRVVDATLAMVADPAPGAAQRLAEQYGTRSTDDPAALLADPDIDAVAVAAPARFHTDLVVAAAAARKPVWCEKPMALTLADADRAIDATDQAGVPLQIGFNRRFDAGFEVAHDAVVAGHVGTVQLMRSLTRDPGLANPAGVPPWTIYLETLIHDFDSLAWLNPGASPVEVFAMADALVAPDFKGNGLLDTSVVLIRWDNGAMSTAEANFSATYGYDIRAEVFGSNGMVTAGDQRSTTALVFGPEGVRADTARMDTKLFVGAYTAEFQAFVDAVRNGTPPPVTGADAKRALAIALAAIKSVEEHRPVRVDEITS
jgi:myo-inositol 2-dehydrogenase / D-chiro-inositol 1-dehydrogenase